MQLIDRDALKDKVKLILNGNTRMKAYAIYAEIETAQTVDAVPVVHGEWIWKTDSTLQPRTCSVCNAYFYLGRGWNYCPNCGAKMDGEKKEDG